MKPDTQHLLLTTFREAFLLGLEGKAPSIEEARRWAAVYGKCSREAIPPEVGPKLPGLKAYDSFVQDQIQQQKLRDRYTQKHPQDGGTALLSGAISGRCDHHAIGEINSIPCKDRPYKPVLSDPRPPLLPNETTIAGDPTSL